MAHDPVRASSTIQKDNNNSLAYIMPIAFIVKLQ